MFSDRLKVSLKTPPLLRPVPFDCNLIFYELTIRCSILRFTRISVSGVQIETSSYRNYVLERFGHRQTEPLKRSTKR